MENPTNKKNPERNRDPLTKVTEEEQRKHAMAEQEAQEAPAIASDEILIRTNGAIRAGVIWA
jgi:hypothetical protein